MDSSWVTNLCLNLSWERTTLVYIYGWYIYILELGYVLKEGAWCVEASRHKKSFWSISSHAGQFGHRLMVRTPGRRRERLDEIGGSEKKVIFTWGRTSSYRCIYNISIYICINQLSVSVTTKKATHIFVFFCALRSLLNTIYKGLLLSLIETQKNRLFFWPPSLDESRKDWGGKKK